MLVPALLTRRLSSKLFKMLAWYLTKAPNSDSKCTLWMSEVVSATRLSIKWPQYSPTPSTSTSLHPSVSSLSQAASTSRQHSHLPAMSLLGEPSMTLLSERHHTCSTSTTECMATSPASSSITRTQSHAF